MYRPDHPPAALPRPIRRARRPNRARIAQRAERVAAATRPCGSSASGQSSTRPNSPRIGSWRRRSSRWWRSSRSRSIEDQGSESPTSPRLTSTGCSSSLTMEWSATSTAPSCSTGRSASRWRTSSTFGRCASTTSPGRSCGRTGLIRRGVAAPRLRADERERRAPRSGSVARPAASTRISPAVFRLRSEAGKPPMTIKRWWPQCHDCGHVGRCLVVAARRGMQPREPGVHVARSVQRSDVVVAIEPLARSAGSRSPANALTAARPKIGGVEPVVGLTPAFEQSQQRLAQAAGLLLRARSGHDLGPVSDRDRDRCRTQAAMPPPPAARPAPRRREVSAPPSPGTCLSPGPGRRPATRYEWHSSRRA